MVTVKRLYLYSVLGVSLILLLWGLTDLVRFALDEVARPFGVGPAVAGSFAREELSRAIALALVAGGIFGVHLAIVRSLLQGTRSRVADERASATRATYVFLVLMGTGAAALWSTFHLFYDLIGVVAFSSRGIDVLDSAAGFIVFGSAWALHLAARRTDLRVAPERLAGDWLMRAYLYGALFVTFLIAAVESGDLLSTVARQAMGLVPMWEGPGWWQAAISDAVAAASAAALGWLLHWRMAAWLTRAPDPVGAAHRTARTRRAYLVGVVAVSAVAVLVFASLSLQHLLAEALGTRVPTDGSTLFEDVGGPLLMLVPFVPLWWWHQRRASREAAALGDEVATRAVVRTMRLAVAFIGLAGLAVGSTWELQALIDALGSSVSGSVITLAGVDGGITPALSLAIVGLALWAPSWAVSQRERARHAVEAAISTSRRAYLMLVSGLAVVAAMGSLAYLVWQAVRLLLESGELEDPSWAVSILVVASTVLIAHLWLLRSDLRVAPLERPVPPAAPAAGRVVETIEISGPADADLRVLNAAIRSELPEGYELRVVSHRP